MCQAHDHESSANVNTGNESISQGFSSASTFGTSTSWNISSATGETGTKTQKKQEHRNKHIARLEMDLLVFKEHLRWAVEELTVPQFFEIRRQFDAVWSEILEEL
jgi:hypothetical protein